ncbi:hypothetical protein RSAG8_10990, partial [Rhizoctonia solani AG-8 WAC10335]
MVPPPVATHSPGVYSTESSLPPYDPHQQSRYPYLPANQHHATEQRVYNQTPASNRGLRQRHGQDRVPAVNLNSTYPNPPAERAPADIPPPEYPAQRGMVPEITRIEREARRAPKPTRASQKIRTPAGPRSLPRIPVSRCPHAAPKPPTPSRTHFSGLSKQSAPGPPNGLHAAAPSLPTGRSSGSETQSPVPLPPTERKTGTLDTASPPQSFLKRLKRLLGLSRKCESGVIRTEKKVWTRTRTETWTVTRSTA